MYPTFSVSFNTALWSAGLGELTGALGKGYLPQMRQARVDIARSVELNFRAQGRSDKWAPLSAVTIARRMKLKKPPVAGLETKLRVTDALRKAAEGQSGSKSTVVVDDFATRIEPDIPYLEAQDEGTEKIPARSFFFLQEADEELLVSRVFGEFERRIAKGWGT